MAKRSRFQLRSYGFDFTTGGNSHGDQFLMGLLCPNVVLYRFDASGRLSHREMRPWLYPAPQYDGIFGIYDDQFRVRIDTQMNEWKAEIGFVEQSIAVEMFFDDEQDVGIMASNDPSIAFVFYWCEEYWMNDAGEVEST